MRLINTISAIPSLLKFVLILITITNLSLPGQAQNATLDSLKNELLSAGSDSVKFALYRNIFLYYSNSDLDSANRYADLFLELSKNHSPYFLQKALNMKGLVFHSKGEHIRAIKNYEKALVIAEKQDYKDEQASLWNNLGNAYGSISNFPKQIESYQRTLELDKESGYRTGVILGYRNIGTSYEMMGDFDRALYYLNLSYMSAKDSIDEVRLAAILSSMGHCLVKVNETDSGLNLLNRALVTYQNAPNQQINEVLMLVYLGDSYAFIKDFKQSVDYLKAAYELSVEINYTEGIRDAALGLSESYINLRRWRAANRYTQEAYNLSSTTEYHQGLTEALSYQIQIEKGLENFQRALDLSEELAILKDSIYSRDRIMRIGALEAENRFNQEKDSLTYAQQREVLALEAERYQDALIRNAIAIVLLITIIFLVNFYRTSKRRKQQSEALETANTKIQLQNEEISKKKEDLEEMLGQLKATQQQLIQNEKMAALGVLASGVGHEINNPLNFIKKGIELVERKLARNKIDSSFLDRDFNIVNDGIDRITKIVGGLRGYSRQDETYEQIDANKILDNCIEIVKSNTKDRVDIEKIYLMNPLCLQGNEGKLHQVFLNVIMNAAQSIDDSGKVVINTREVADFAEIHIQDSGCGIPKEEISRLGEPFYTTKPAGQGTGMGLFIAFDIIKQHGGIWHIDSRPGEGTTFSIYIPRKATKDIN